MSRARALYIDGIETWMEFFPQEYLDLDGLLQGVSESLGTILAGERKYGLPNTSNRWKRQPEFATVFVGILWNGATRAEAIEVFERALDRKTGVKSSKDSFWAHCEDFISAPSKAVLDGRGAAINQYEFRRRTVANATAFGEQYYRSQCTESKHPENWSFDERYITPEGREYLYDYYEKHRRPHPYFPEFISYVLDRLDIRNRRIGRAKVLRAAGKELKTARPVAEEKVRLPSIELDFDF